MNRAETKELAKQIIRESPECRVTGVLKFGGDDFALEVHDTELDENFQILNEKDWFVRRTRKQERESK